jgi:hypothetical protein
VFVRRHDADEVLLRHEAVHVWQSHSLGWPRFALRYVREFLDGVRGGFGFSEAYLAVSFEEQARALSALKP